MSKIGRQSETNGIKDFKLAVLIRSIMDMVDGRLVFEDNMQGKIIRGVFFEKADFDYPIQHNLGRTVTDYIILNKNNYSSFRNGKQTSTPDRIYISCNTANTTADILILG